MCRHLGTPTPPARPSRSPLLLHAHPGGQVGRAARAKHRLLLELPPFGDALLHCGEVVDGGADVEREDGVAVLVVGEVVVVDDIWAGETGPRSV